MRSLRSFDVALALPIVVALGTPFAACSEEGADGPTPPAATGGAPAGAGGEPNHAGGTGGARSDAGEGGSGYDPEDRPPCTVSAPTACPDDWPVYADVEPLLAERCVTCHFGMRGGPWPLTTYAHVTAWREEIRAALLTCAMPPPEEGPPLPNDESLLILTWIRCGMPP